MRDLEVRRLEDDLRRGIQVSEDGGSSQPVRGNLDFVGEDTARQEARESLRRKLLAVDEDFSLEVQRAFTTLVELLVAPNFAYDSRATVELKVEAARKVPRESTETYKKGQVVLRGGEQVTPFIVSVLTRMNETGTATQGKRTWLGILAFVLSLLLLFWVLVERGTVQLWKERKDAVFFGLVLVSVLALIKASLVLTTGISPGMAWSSRVRTALWNSFCPGANACSSLSWSTRGDCICSPALRPCRGFGSR